jgi:hypothetical protein
MDCDTVPEYVGIVAVIPSHRIRIVDIVLSCRRVRVGVRWEVLSTTSYAPCRQILSCTTSYGLSWGFSDHIVMRVRPVVSVLPVLLETFSFSTQFYEFTISVLTHTSKLSSHEYDIRVAQLGTYERTHTARVTPN